MGNLTLSKDSGSSLSEYGLFFFYYLAFPSEELCLLVSNHFRFLVLWYFSSWSTTRKVFLSKMPQRKYKRNKISSQRYGLVLLLFNVWKQLYFLSRFLLLMHQKTKFNLCESFMGKAEVLDIIFCNLTFLLDFSWLFLQLKAIIVFKTHTLCQLDTSYSHLRGWNLNWRNASISQSYRHAYRTSS